MQQVEISRIDVRTQRIERSIDFVAEEKPMHVFLNQEHYVTILCSPNQLKELAIGHLLSEGALKSINEIREIRMERDGRCQIQLNPGINHEKRIAFSKSFTRLITSVCGPQDYWPLSKLIDRLDLPKLSLDLKVNANVILESARQLNKLAETFRKTGGVHVATISSTDGRMLALAEDIGRHNAVDKVIGAGVSKSLDFEEHFLSSSGRLTGDLVLKAARMHIPIVASLSAAIDSGIEAARRTGITLIGFVRGKRMNVYTEPKRIVLVNS